MKSLITFTLIFATSVFTVSAAQSLKEYCAKAATVADTFSQPSARQQVRAQAAVIRNHSVEMQGDSLVVVFDAEIPARYLSSGEAYVMTPVLANGNSEVRLPALAVEGRNYGLVNRYNSKTACAEKVRYDGKAQTVHYRRSVPATAEVKHAALRVDATRRTLCPSCVTKHPDTSTPLAGNQPDDFSAFAGKTQIIYYTPADYMVTELYVNDFDGKSIYRSNGVTVDGAVFDPIMTKVISEYDRLKTNSDAAIQAIRVRVASSPDGQYAYNKMLAEKRAANVREHLRKSFRDMNESIVEIVPEAENWDGFLQNLSASGIPNKAAIEQIVRNTQNPDQREAELRKLREWPAIFQLFRQTRNGRIEVEYTRKQHYSHTCPVNAQGLVESRLNVPVGYITVAEATRIAAIDSTSAHLNNLMVAYMENGDYERARACADRIPDADLTPEIANNKAVLCDLTGNQTGAEKYFNRADTPARNYNRGVMALNAGDEAQAKKLLKPYAEN